MRHVRDINVGHLFCGLGGGAKGFNRGEARLGKLEARFNCLGGIDVDAAACRDFARLSGASATCLDMFTRKQYVAFHGHEPPVDWREAVPDDIRRAFGNRHPHILFLSAPCKGFSGLLSERLSTSGRYQALNGLTLWGVWLALEAFKDDPVELIVFENVPRIATRGRRLLDQIVALLRAYGYAVAETKHDCGEIGNLAQSRKRFLLVARHAARVPNFLYEPVKRPLRGVGEVLDRLPLPLSGLGGPMHRMPSLQWKTWVRLAFVEAGSDWRSLNKLRVADGVLADFGIAPDAIRHGGFLGVRRWEDHSGAVTSRGYPNTGAFAVADPRVDGHPKSVQLGVRPWQATAGVVTGKMFVGGGPNAVADPRIPGTRFNSTYRIVRFDETSPAVAGPGGPAGGLAVADPRTDNEFGGMRVVPWPRNSGSVTGQRSPGSSAMCVADPRQVARADYKQTKYRVTGFDEAAGTVISASSTGNGAFAVADPRTSYGPNRHRNVLRVTPWDKHSGVATGNDHVTGGALCVADPRPEFARDGRKDYQTGGHYGVVAYDDASGAVTASGQHDNGRWAVADPRIDDLPGGGDRLVCVIRALDDTWHRPFTTLELAALQGLVDPDETLELDGLSASAWRERIGNAVPPPAAAAIAGVMGRTLLAAWSGETSAISSEPVWVRPVAIALMAARAEGVL